MTETFDLNAIRARSDSATPGPWVWTGTLIEAPDDEIIWWTANATDDSPLGACGLNAEANEQNNGAFLAAARDDVPALLAVLDDAIDLVRRLVEADDDPCQIDHNDCCQMHVHSSPCPVPLARQLLERLGR